MKTMKEIIDSYESSLAVKAQIEGHRDGYFDIARQPKFESSRQALTYQEYRRIGEEAKRTIASFGATCDFEMLLKSHRNDQDELGRRYARYIEQRILHLVTKLKNFKITRFSIGSMAWWVYGEDVPVITRAGLISDGQLTTTDDFDPETYKLFELEPTDDRFSCSISDAFEAVLDTLEETKNPRLGFIPENITIEEVHTISEIRKILDFWVDQPHFPRKEIYIPVGACSMCGADLISSIGHYSTRGETIPAVEIYRCVECLGEEIPAHSCLTIEAFFDNLRDQKQ